MGAIYRQEVPVGEWFMSREVVTFGYQESRQSFGVWFMSEDPSEAKYIILGTGHACNFPINLVASLVMPDGFHVFHLCRIVD